MVEKQNGLDSLLLDFSDQIVKFIVSDLGSEKSSKEWTKDQVVAYVEENLIGFSSNEVKAVIENVFGRTKSVERVFPDLSMPTRSETQSILDSVATEMKNSTVTSDNLEEELV